MSADKLITTTSRSDFPFIFLGPRLKGRSWAMYFVITPEKTFVVKGGTDVVDEYVRKIPVCIYRYTYWMNGISRGGWRANGLFIDHRENTFVPDADYFSFRLILYKGYYKANPHDRFIISSKKKENWDGLVKGTAKVLLYRRLPKKWLSEWDEFVYVKPAFPKLTFPNS